MGPTQARARRRRGPDSTRPSAGDCPRPLSAARSIDRWPGGVRVETRLVECGDRAGTTLTGQNRIAYDALVRAIDDGEQAGTTLPKLSEGVSARCLVDLWRTEYGRFRSDGSDITSDSIRRAFDRAKGALKKAGVVGYYDNLAWIIWEAPDKPDKTADT